MRKIGFTLAEILITLAIIGVVSALVMPTFTASTQRAKIGPKLSKAVSVFSQAMQAVLDDAQSDSISDAMVKCTDDATTLSALTSSNACFLNNLAHHLKGSVSGNTFTGTDNVSYTLANAFAAPVSFPSGGTAGLYPHNNTIMNPVIIDINGSAGTGAEGYEVFYFYLMDDGSLIPFGSSSGPSSETWTSKCAADTVPTAPKFCAGHIFENNLKVLYK